jgi:hypothetical protein
MRFGRNVGKAVAFPTYAAARAVYEDAATMGRTVALLELVGTGEVKVLLLNGCKRDRLPHSLALQVARKLGGDAADPFSVPIVLNDEPHDDEQDDEQE